MRFPSRYVLLVLAPLALGTGCSSRSIFKNSSGESVFSFKKKDKEAESTAKSDSKKDDAKDKDAKAKDSKSLAAAPGKTDPKKDTKTAAKPDPKAKDAAGTGSSSNLLAKAKELEQKGDYDGAAKIYREILAEDSKKSDKPTTRTAAASKDDQPKTLAKKSGDPKSKTASSDPWLDDLEPLPSTNPKAASPAEKSGAGSGKTLAGVAAAGAASSNSRVDWAKRAADPDTSQSDRVLIEKALKTGDVDELDNLADLLDLDEMEEPKPANKFAQRDAEKSPPAKKPEVAKAAPAASQDDAEVADAPAWAKNRPAPLGDKPATRSAADELLPSRIAKTEAPDKEPAAPEAAEKSDAPWRATRATARANDDAAGFEKPLVKVAAADPVPKEAKPAPVLGARAEVASREGWNATSLQRLCQDCDPLVVAQVKKLDSQYPDVRKDGIIELTRMGSIARPAGLALRAMLDDTDPMVQAYAAWGLWELENDTLDSVQVLGGLLGNTRPEVVELACYSLASMGTTASEAVPALEELRDTNHGVERLRAAEALIRVRGADERSVDVLSVAIKSNDRQVRWIAANGLGHVRGPQATRAVDTLILALGDADSEVQAAAALALGGMGEAALKALPKLDELRSSKTAFVRESADSSIKCLSRN